MAKWRTLRIFSTLLVVLLLAGCFEYRETITINKEGEVEFAILASVLESVVPFLKNRSEYALLLGTLAGPGVMEKMLPPGAEVVRAKTVTSQGWVHTDLAIRFKSLQDVVGGASKVLSGQEFKWFEEADGSMYYERMVYKPDMQSVPGGIGAKIQENHWKEAKLHYELQTPLKIISTNGKKRTDYKVVWDTDMAFVKEKGLKLWVKFEPAPKAPDPILVVGAIAILMMFLGGYWQWRRKRVHTSLAG